MWTYEHSNELYHHGIKGMQWGVRRFRNEDGSLTPAGERRYSTALGKKRTAKKVYKVLKKTEKAQREYEKLTSKQEKAEAKGRTKKAEKLASKASSQERRFEKYQRKADRIEARAKAFLASKQVVKNVAKGTVNRGKDFCAGPLKDCMNKSVTAVKGAASKTVTAASNYAKYERKK